MPAIARSILILGPTLDKDQRCQGLCRERCEIEFRQWYCTALLITGESIVTALTDVRHTVMITTLLRDARKRNRDEDSTHCIVLSGYHHITCHIINGSGPDRTNWSHPSQSKLRLYSNQIQFLPNARSDAPKIFPRGGRVSDRREARLLLCLTSTSSSRSSREHIRRLGKAQRDGAARGL